MRFYIYEVFQKPNKWIIEEKRWFGHGQDCQSFWKLVQTKYVSSGKKNNQANPS